MLRFSPASRRAVLLTLAAGTIGVVGVVGCGAFGPPRSMTLSEGDLQRLLDKHFPLERRLLEVLEVSIATPRLQLQGEHNRIATELQISTRDRLFGGQWQGRLALDSMLRWESADQTLRMSQVRVTQVSLDTGGSLARAQAERLGAVLAERVLEGLVVYRLPAERAERLQRAGVQPAGVAVTSRGVEIAFEPVPR